MSAPLSKPRVIHLPDPSLVVLIGASGSGKSTFARAHFKPTEVLTSDAFRAIVSDDENDQSVTGDAFEALHFVLGKRLKNLKLTVVDATNVQQRARESLLRVAHEHDLFAHAIVLDVPTEVCVARNAVRKDRNFGGHVVVQQRAQLRSSVRHLEKEGFRGVHVLSGVEAVESARIERAPLWCDRRDERGPFDIVGDVHGCREELERLLDKLGYARDAGGVYAHAGRRLIFLGDLCDRGPDTPGVYRIVMAMVRAGTALCVPGNHDAKLHRWLGGKNVKMSHGLAQSAEQLERESEGFRAEVREFIDSLVSHQVLDGGRLVVAHAGLQESYQGRSSGRVRSFCLYGETTGEVDEYGLPVRADWARKYRGRATVVYGHTPVPIAEWVGDTVCVDTGCVFGGKLTALRWPERELVDVAADRVWFEPARPLAAAAVVPEREPDALELTDVLGTRSIATRFDHPVTIREENAAAALEVMSRFAIDPRWLIHLPATMSPAEAAKEGPWLERPEQCFDHYRKEGVTRVVCEEKHMGSRAIAVICKHDRVGHDRFGADARLGVIYTRTGRAFFGDEGTEQEVLRRLRDAIAGAGLFEELATDWLCLDCEILPWSAKAQSLLREQYAPVGAAGLRALGDAGGLLAQALARDPSAASLAERVARRHGDVARYVEAYGRYCWEVGSVDDLAVAPFHVLASEGAVHHDRDHLWHLAVIDRIAGAAPALVRKTERVVVALGEGASEDEAVRWWEALTGRGGEGAVIKPLAWLARGRRGLAQPALKCRGREYLRIIYGPEHTAEEHLARLRKRGLSAKRRLALKEHVLGLEALSRFVERRPLYEVHQCVFGVLALESEPVDPRL